MAHLGTSLRCYGLLQRCLRDKRSFFNVQAVSVSTSTNSSTLNDNTETQAKPYNAILGPRGVYNLPMVGFLFHMKPFGNFTTGTIHLLFDEMIERYGPIFKIRLNAPTVVITELKDLSVVVRNEGKYPYRPNFDLLNMYYKRTKTEPAMGALQGEKWLELRQPAQKTLLKPGQASQYLPMMNEVADDFVQMLRSGYLRERDPEKPFMCYMAETAGTAFFNKRLGFLNETISEESKKLQKALVDVFDLLYQTSVGNSNGFRLYRSKDYKKFEAAFGLMRGLNANYVKEAKDELRKKQELGTLDPDQPNMMLSLLNEHSEEKTALIIESLYFASVDSSAAGVQVFLYNLAKNQDKQDKLRDEIRSVLGDSIKIITQEHLDNMRYLKACLKEIYRLHHFIPFGPTRVLPVDVELGGYKIPAGVQIYNYSGKACRDETIFENPHEYQPERWLRQNKLTKSEPTMDRQNTKGHIDTSWAILPFGVGRRMCPGRRLFEQELCLAVAKLIQHTRVGLEPESMDVGFEYKMFLKPVKPLKFTFTPLDTNTTQ